MVILSRLVKMGLNEYEEILAKMFAVCPSAFHDTMPWMKRGHTIIDDGLMRLRFVLGPNIRRGKEFGYHFTGCQFYELFVGVIFSALRGNCGNWVECFDISSLVPLEKEKEQLKRSASFAKAKAKDPSKAWKRYPYNIVLCDDGVRWPDGKVEMFDIRGIMSYSHTRDKAIHYVIDKLLEGDPLPLGTQIILDFEKEGPIQIIREEGTPRNGAFRLHAWNHLFGEADLQMAMWTWLFRSNDVEIRSGDTDTLGVIGGLVEKAARDSFGSGDEKKRTREAWIAAVNKIFPNKIIWSRGAMRGKAQTADRQNAKARAKRLAAAKAQGKRLDEKEPEIRTHHKPIELPVLVKALLQLGVTMKVVNLILCHGMGSDFNEKAALAAQTGVVNVWRDLLAHKEPLDQITWDDASLFERGRRCVWKQIIGSPNVVQAGYIYRQHGEWKDTCDDTGFQQAYEYLCAFWDKVPRNRQQESSDEMKEFGVMMCLWGTQYWMFPFSTLILEPPSPFATKREWED